MQQSGTHELNIPNHTPNSHPVTSEEALKKPLIKFRMTHAGLNQRLSILLFWFFRCNQDFCFFHNSAALQHGKMLFLVE